jgi:uncharacterized protein YqfA (UPF0365 family)
MKYLPFIVVIIVQQLAMIFFMRVVRLDLFLSAGLSAATALAVYALISAIQRRLASRKNHI